MKQFFIDLWAKCCELYGYYSSFIHSIFPKELGDLVEYILDIIIACLIIKMIADVAFKTKSGDN